MSNDSKSSFDPEQTPAGTESEGNQYRDHKENTHMNIDITRCCAQLKSGASCTFGALNSVVVLAHGNNAYNIDHLPLAYADEMWEQVLIGLCGAHTNQLKRVHNITLNFTYIPKEDTVPTTKEPDDYDDQYSYKNSVRRLDRRPFDTEKLPLGGHLLIERCDHDDCHADHMETVHEARGEDCCGDPNCNHYFPVLCLHHTPKPQSEKHRHFHNDQTWHWWHDRVQAEILMDNLRDNGVECRMKKSKNDHGWWVIWRTTDTPEGLLTNQEVEIRAAKSIVETMIPVVDDLGEVVAQPMPKKRIRCGNCVKNKVEDPYHNTKEEVKACYGR